jgi:AcrR family transcriptional regulator
MVNKKMNEKTETRERILFAAKKEFADKGFNGARMNSIAKRARANQALIHYYFEGKEKLYVEVLHRLFGINQADVIKNDISTWKLEPDQALYVAIYLLIEIHLEATDPDLNKIIAREIAEGHENLKTLIREYFIPRLNSIEEIIKQGIKKGIFSTVNPLLAVMQLVTFVISFENGKDNYAETEWYEKLYGPDKKKQLFNFLLNHTFKGLRPDNKKLSIPDMPGELIKKMDSLIDEMKSRQSWKEWELYEK